MCTCKPVPLAGQQKCEAFVAAVNSRSIMTGLLKGGNMKKGMFKKKQVLLFTSLFSLLLNSYFFSPQKKRFIFFKFHLTYAICSVVAAVLLQCSRLQEALYFVAKQTQHKGRKVDKICEFQEKRFQRHMSKMVMLQDTVRNQKVMEAPSSELEGSYCLFPSCHRCII